MGLHDEFEGDKVEPFMTFTPEDEEDEFTEDMETIDTPPAGIPRPVHRHAPGTVPAPQGYGSRGEQPSPSDSDVDWSRPGQPSPSSPFSSGATRPGRQSIPSIPAKTPYDRARAHMSPERQEEADRLKDELGGGRESVIWDIVQALSFSESFFKDIPADLKAAAKEIADSTQAVAHAAVAQVGAALGTIDHKTLATHIAGQVSARVGRGFATRFRIQWGIIGGALALAIFLCGLFVGRGLDLGHYRERYDLKVMALPHVRNVLLSPSGAAISSLIERNDPSTLYALARCSSDLGLRLLPAHGGGKVCAGVGASKGFWIAPSP